MSERPRRDSQSGSIPSYIEAQDTATFKLGQGDIPGALDAHFKVDRIHHHELMHVVTRERKYVIVWSTVRVILVGAAAVLGVYGREIVTSVFERAAVPLLEKQSQQFTDTVNVSLRNFKASVDEDANKARARIDALEAAAAARRHR